MINECRHLNTLDPMPSLPVDERVIWCMDCGALILPSGLIRSPKIFLHIFACPMCGQAPYAKPVRNIFLKGDLDYSCPSCGFKPVTGSDLKVVTLEIWNKAVWEIIVGELDDLRHRYRDALAGLQAIASSEEEPTIL